MNSVNSQTSPEATPEAMKAPAEIKSVPYLRNAFLLVALVTLVRLATLAVSDFNLYGDEAQYWTWSLDLAAGYFTKPPLIAWLIRAATTLFGDSEFALRAASPLLHAATGMILFAVGREMFGARVGFWSAALYITIPGISFSALLISTDVPLLTAWAAALWCYMRLLDRRSLGFAVLLGVAVGTGLLAKYAMVYFIICAVLAGFVTPRARWLLTSKYGALVLALALAMLAPNIWWNATNGFATITHTADNASWAQPFNNPKRALEFVGAQLAVFGPVPFIGLLVMGWVWWRGRLNDKEKLLLTFVLPILAVITLQGLISRANANWAATAYVAATPALVAWWLRLDRRKIVSDAVGWHAAVALFGYLTVVVLSQWPDAPGAQLAKRLRGWDIMGAEIMARNTQKRPIMGDRRLIMADIIYYTRDHGNTYRMWDTSGRLDSHYELSIPYVSGSAFLVTDTPNTGHITRCFAILGPQEKVTIDTGGDTTRPLYMQALDDFKGC